MAVAYPAPKNAAASAVMRGNTRRDTRPEIALRSALWRIGLRYYVDRPIGTAARRIRPDLVFPKARVAVFVDGCYWHGCEDHWKAPTHNSSYWVTKVERNRARDSASTLALAAEGWTVIRIWEHEDMDRAAEQVRIAVATARKGAS